MKDRVRTKFANTHADSSVFHPLLVKRDIYCVIGGEIGKKKEKGIVVETSYDQNLIEVTFLLIFFAEVYIHRSTPASYRQLQTR